MANSEYSFDHAYRYFGAHIDGNGVRFRTWAPNAREISIVGDFNGWDAQSNFMTRLEYGVWEGFVPDIDEYALYKFAVLGEDGVRRMKADPYAFYSEVRPATASKVYSLDKYEWNDSRWIEYKKKYSPFNRPMNIYEVHLGSWRLHEDGTLMTYRELADQLVSYVKEMGYTHIELLPVTEFPYDGSWGYQVTGYFSATSRFGEPRDFMYLVDTCHQNGIGVILDWVPAHFPKDEAGLYRFDGSWLYEYYDERKREHKEWGTMVFDFGRDEVRSFLISSAMFWIEEFHIDGIRVDAVASMLYLDYGRGGDFTPNVYGGRENLEAVSFLQELNSTVVSAHPQTIMIAEESTAWPLVTKPPYDGGLGFHYKWNMGWMNDTLSYVAIDPYFKSGCHDKLTFSMTYALQENYILPLSHDEVVHGKCSLIEKQPGDYWQKFAGLRTLFGYMMTHPGKKLSFMGSEFAQFIEWDYHKQLDWFLLDYEMHRKYHDYIRALNAFYISHSQLWQVEDDWSGFKWLLVNERDRNLYAYMRRNKRGEALVVVCNFSASGWNDVTIPVLSAGKYVPVLCSDEERFGGAGNVPQEVISHRGGNGELRHEIKVDIPPLSMCIFKRERNKKV